MVIVFVIRMHPNLVFLWQKGRNLQAMSITGDCRLATPINFIRGHLSCRKLDSFGLVFVFSSLGFVQMSCWWSCSWTTTSLFTACIFHEYGVCAWYISWVFLLRRNVIQVSSRLYQVKSWSWQKVCMAPGSNADKIGKIIVFVMLNLLWRIAKLLHNIKQN